MGIEIWIWGLILTVFSGLTLGLVGGGGTILMLPILHYVMGFSISASTRLSMAIVGVTAFVGSLEYFRRGDVAIRAGFIFAIPSLLSVTMVRAFILPKIPTSIATVGHVEITKDKAILLLFSCVMILVAMAMLRPVENPSRAIKNSVLSMSLSSAIVGLLTGFVGAGGGFLIVPALHLILNLPLRMAIGTSLFVIFINSVVGFAADLIKGSPLPWSSLAIVIVASVLGMFFGLTVSKKVRQHQLKKAFAFFILIIASLIFLKEFL